MEVIQQVIDWYMQNIGYLTIFLLMLIESTVLPMPSELVIPPAAYLAAGGEFGFADPEGLIPTSSRLAEVKPESGTESIPSLLLSLEELADGLGILNLLVKAGLSSSNSEARRLIKGGGCYMDDLRISDERQVVVKEDFKEGVLTLRAGKKARKRILLQS